MRRQRAKLCRRLRGADLHAAIDRHRIHRQNVGADAHRERDGCCGFSASGRSREKPRAIQDVVRNLHESRRSLILSIAFTAVSPLSRTHFCNLYKPAEKSPKSACGLGGNRENAALLIAVSMPRSKATPTTATPQRSVVLPPHISKFDLDPAEGSSCPAATRVLPEFARADRLSVRLRPRRRAV